MEHVFVNTSLIPEMLWRATAIKILLSLIGSFYFGYRHGEWRQLQALHKATGQETNPDGM